MAPRKKLPKEVKPGEFPPYTGDEETDAVRAMPLVLQWADFNQSTFKHPADDRPKFFKITERQLVEIHAQVRMLIKEDPYVTDETDCLAALAHIYEKDPKLLLAAVYFAGVEHGKIRSSGKRTPNLASMLQGLFG